MRLIVAGSRSCTDRDLVRRKLNTLTKAVPVGQLVILTGGARGADELGELWAWERWVTVERYHPDRSKGKAGFIARNEDMARAATHLVAFWDGESRGTLDMIRRARKHGLKVRIIYTGD